MRTTTHTVRPRRSGMALCGVVALLFTGCASATPDGGASPVDAVDQQTEDVESGLTADAIIAAIEPHGLVCDEEEPRLKSNAQVIVCKGDNYVIITATRLVDAGLVDGQVAAAKKAVCESGFKIDGTRFAVSDAWILSPGGGDDRNIATFDAAMNTLGLDWSEDLC